MRLHGENKYLTAKFDELIKPPEKKSKKTAEQIINEVIRNSGITLVGGEEE